MQKIILLSGKAEHGKTTMANFLKEKLEDKLQKRFIECINSTNLNAINECISFLEDLPFEVIEIALKKASEVNGSWKYAKKILNASLFPLFSYSIYICSGIEVNEIMIAIITIIETNISNI